MTNTGADACVLLLDTSGDTGTIALAVDGELRIVKRLERARDYAAVLNETVDTVLAEGGVAMRDLTAICMLAGPGSYTGLRIALAAAKGWCYALDIPLFLQAGLQVLAEEARETSAGYEVYVAVLPARQSEYFFAAYDATGEVLIAPRHLKLPDAAEVLRGLPARCLAIGNETSVAEIFSAENFAGNVPKTIARSMPSAEVWWRVTKAQIQAGSLADLAYAEPFYLKAAHTTTPKASR